jgi:hypothetical protein
MVDLQLKLLKVAFHVVCIMIYDLILVYILFHVLLRHYLLDIGLIASFCLASKFSVT